MFFFDYLNKKVLHLRRQNIYITIIHITMNKTEFIDAIATKADINKLDAKKALEAAISTISNEMKKGGKVSFLGFGSFSVVTKAARKGINLQTKQTIDIPARKCVKFKVGADLAKAVE